MPTPPQEFLSMLRAAVRLIRWALLGAVVLVALLFAVQVHQFYLLFAAMHPIAGVLFLLAVAAAVWFLVGRPVWEYLRVPVAVTPPALPSKEEGLAAVHLVKHLDYVDRYLRAQWRNPLLAEARAQVAAAVDEGQRLRDAVAARSAGGLDQSLQEIRAFEQQRVEPLLAPLDAEAERIIRQEALGVGVATAVALNGTLDAVIVLWRNVNLTTRIAKVYYGRPGPRGSLIILRDVSLAVLLSNYLDNIADTAGHILGRWMGHVAGVVAGPVINGGVNAVVTMRLGYLAKTRCRAFKAWTEDERRSAVVRCLAMAKEASTGLLAELATRLGSTVGGVAAGAMTAGSALYETAKDLVTWPFRRGEGEPV